MGSELGCERTRLDLGLGIMGEHLCFETPKEIRRTEFRQRDAVVDLLGGNRFILKCQTFY